MLKYFRKTNALYVYIYIYISPFSSLPSQCCQYTWKDFKGIVVPYQTYIIKYLSALRKTSLAVRLGPWGLNYILRQRPWCQSLSAKVFTDISGRQTSNVWAFIVAGSLLCLPKYCFVCGWVHTPNCHLSVDTSHHPRCLWVSEQWPDKGQISRKEICSVNTGSCQWIWEFLSQVKPLRTVCFDTRCQVCNHWELTLHLPFEFDT